jgi:hypothetical protein
MSDAEFRSTHGFVVKASAQDANREFHFHRLSDGSITMKLVTNWPDGEPLVTCLRFTADGFSLFAEGVNEAAMNMGSWPLPPNTTKETA